MVSRQGHKIASHTGRLSFPCFQPVQPPLQMGLLTSAKLQGVDSGKVLGKHMHTLPARAFEIC